MILLDDMHTLYVFKMQDLSIYIVIWWYMTVVANLRDVKVTVDSSTIINVLVNCRMCDVEVQDYSAIHSSK